MESTIFDKHTFFAPPASFSGDDLVFPEDEARHASRVLRLSEGMVVQVVDGCAGRYRVRLTHVSRRGVTGVVEDRPVRETDVEPLRIILAVGLIKNASRYETMLEKAAEIGVSRIVPMITLRTEKSGLRMERAQAILVSAMKQSGRSRLVDLADPQPFDAVLETARTDEPDGSRIICHEGTSLSACLLEEAPAAGHPTVYTVLIGPEGGFTDDEMGRAVAGGFRPVSLGGFRLRTETAAIVAVSGIVLQAAAYVGAS